MGGQSAHRLPRWRTVNHQHSLSLFVAAAFAQGPIASSGLRDEIALAQRYAPVVRLVSRDHRCTVGPPFRPMDVNTLFDRPTVALRGPWGHDEAGGGD